MPLVRFDHQDGTQQLLIVALCFALVVGTLGAVLAPDHSVQIIGFATLGIMQFMALIQGIRAKQAARGAAEVGAANHENIKDIKHLVNGGYGAVLMTTYRALQRIADLTNTPEDRAAAALAKEQWLNHESRSDSATKEKP
jgi:hypothetical protein